MMPRLRVVHPGMFTTVQDLGRPGHSAIGVPPSGATDTLSLTIGNRLLGNPDSAAVLECTLHGPSVTIDRDAWVCLAGADCPNACIEGTSGDRPLTSWEATRVNAGELITVGGMRGGARSWLSVSGGIDVPVMLGSRSTFVAARIGGHEGRTLRSGDELPVNPTKGEPRVLPEGLHAWMRRQLERRSVRVVPSLHTDLFPPEAIAQLTSATYTVSEKSNRTGIRLDGQSIPLPESVGSLDSEPTVTGGVQIPGDARPIVLGVDRPTTGGYPLLACVINADLPAVAMLRPRDSLRFEAISIEAARRLATGQDRTLDTWLPPCEVRPSA